MAFTLNSLRDLGPKVKWGVDVQQVMKEAKATDANTVVVDFKVPAPRFFFFMTYKYDIGVYIVPKHIFAGQDWTTFKHFDIAKGWPVTHRAVEGGRTPRRSRRCSTGAPTGGRRRPGWRRCRRSSAPSGCRSPASRRRRRR